MGYGQINSKKIYEEVADAIKIRIENLRCDPLQRTPNQKGGHL